MVETNNNKSDQRELCVIRIIFPVDSDDKAIEYKKKIRTILSDESEAKIIFTTSPPMTGKPYAS